MGAKNLPASNRAGQVLSRGIGGNSAKQVRSSLPARSPESGVNAPWTRLKKAVGPEFGLHVPAARAHQLAEDFEQAIQLLRPFRLEAIELFALREDELEPLLAASTK